MRNADLAVMASWQSVHPAMGLGDIQPAHPAIPEPEGLVFDEERGTVAPDPRTALHAGGMRLQSATAAITPGVRKPDCVLNRCPVPVLGEQSAGPSDELDLGALNCRLPIGKRQYVWNVCEAVHAPQNPELQRSAEPRRIWNRVYLGLTLAQLAKTGVQTSIEIQNPNLLQPETSRLLQEPDLQPIGAFPIQREALGFPIPHEMTLELTQYMPPPAIQDPLQIGLRSKVTLPSVPRLIIVSA